MCRLASVVAESKYSLRVTTPSWCPSAWGPPRADRRYIGRRGFIGWRASAQRFGGAALANEVVERGEVDQVGEFAWSLPNLLAFASDEADDGYDAKDDKRKNYHNYD